MAAQQPWLTDLVRHRVARLATALDAGRPVDLYAELAADLPLLVLARLVELPDAPADAVKDFARAALELFWAPLDEARQLALGGAARRGDRGPPAVVPEQPHLPDAGRVRGPPGLTPHLTADESAVPGIAGQPSDVVSDSARQDAQGDLPAAAKGPRNPRRPDESQGESAPIGGGATRAPRPTVAA